MSRGGGLQCHVLVVMSRVLVISQPLAVLCVLCVSRGGGESAVPPGGGGEQGASHQSAFSCIVCPMCPLVVVCSATCWWW